MSSDPLVSVLILNYRNPNATVQCVLHLLEQTLSDQIEVIVVDNHSEDDSIGILRNRLGAYENVHLVETPRNRGFGYGYNKGARYATGDYILLNNPDKVLMPDGIEKLVEKMQSDASIGILAPKLMHSDGTRRYSARAYPRLFDLIVKRTFLKHIFKKSVRHYLQLDADPDEERAVDWIVGGCFMIERAFFEKLHGFDEDFFLFFEDTDLCRRCIRAGKNVYYYPHVIASDRKHRLSDMPLLRLPFNRIGRAHIRSALLYFWKWGCGTEKSSLFRLTA